MLFDTDEFFRSGFFLRRCFGEIPERGYCRNDSGQLLVVPAEVYGHVFTAQERANLQDGKAILVSDLKSANNKTFSSYLKVNANSGQLQYFQENPDIRRNTARRAAQVDDTQNRQQEQKKGSRQAV